MFRDKRRYGQDPNKVDRSADATFRKPLAWQRKAEKEGGRQLVFTCSWSDWFIEEADAWRDEAWAIIKRCPLLTFQVLTKRAERIADHLPADWGDGYPNVWLGVSAENQKYADERIPPLLRVPAAVRFVSAEPLLGPIDLNDYLDCGYESGGPAGWMPEPGLDWVISGGESGTDARPSHPDWFRSLRDQCRASGVAFHFKQWGEHGPDQVKPIRCTPVSSGVPMDEPASVFRVGVKAAGRMLDGRTWDEFPAPAVPAPGQMGFPGFEGEEAR